MLPTYQSLTYSDFTDQAAAAAYRRALERVGAELGGHAPLVIGGRHVTTDDVIRSTDPAEPDRGWSAPRHRRRARMRQKLSAPRGRRSLTGPVVRPRSGRLSCIESVI